MQPIWLLDIDGVINASAHKIPTHVWPEDQWMQVVVTDYRPKDWTITAAQPVLDFITRVHEGQWAEVVWLTTWQGEANLVGDALSLPELRSIYNPMHRETRYSGDPTWWKLAEATRELAARRPVVWTDDDIGKEASALFLAEARVDTLIIAPDSSEGLGPGHLDRIAAFLGMPKE